MILEITKSLLKMGYKDIKSSLELKELPKQVHRLDKVKPYNIYLLNIPIQFFIVYNRVSSFSEKWKTRTRTS